MAVSHFTFEASGRFKNLGVGISTDEMVAIAAVCGRTIYESLKEIPVA